MTRNEAMLIIVIILALVVLACIALTFAVCKWRMLGALQWWAFRHPYRDIGNYMGRWWVIPGLVRLHHIKRPDRGDLHDHPGNWTTRVLSGWYIELDIYGKTHLRAAGDTVSRKAHEFHKIVDVSPGGCWTLFSMPRRINRWGFLVGGVKMPYKQYHRERFEQ
jgi:hypothetical protein